MQNYWYDPQIKNTYKNGGTLNKILLANQTYRGRNTTNLLASQRVRDYAREYYNCSTLPGMQLENEGSEGSLGSHWERVILENEYMTASAITSDAAFSKFTSFLLLDTGWYDYVDLSLADEI